MTKMTGTLDEALRPMTMTCGTCGGDLVCYPKEWSGQEEQSVNYCDNCSPAWLKSFGEYLMDTYRQEHGLEPIAESGSKAP